MIVLSEDRYHWTLGLVPGEGRAQTPMLIGIPQLGGGWIADGHMLDSSHCLSYCFRLNNLRRGRSPSLREGTHKFGYKRLRS